MDKALISLVLLKYEILTSDLSTWHLCDTYPREVRSKWAWRCAADCEHLAKGHPEAEECIDVTKRYRDGLGEMPDWENIMSRLLSIIDVAAYYAVRSHYHAARYEHLIVAPALAADTACESLIAIDAGPYCHNEEKWDLYISWLIEELGAWEQALTSREAVVDQ